MKALKYISNWLPYLAGYSCGCLVWIFISMGMHPVLALAVSFTLILPPGFLRGHYWLKEQKEQEAAEADTQPCCLPVTVGPSPDITDEITELLPEDNHDGKTDEIPTLPDSALEIMDDIIGDTPKKDPGTGAICIEVFVDSKRVQEMWFPPEREVLKDKLAMVKHAKKYSSVATALRGKIIDNINFKESRLVHFHTRK